MFQMMQAAVKEDFATYMFHIEAVVEEEGPSQPAHVREERRQIPMANMTATGSTGVDPAEASATVDTAAVAAEAGGGVKLEQRVSDKVPRNAPCPCGSGKKYKQCHGRPDAPAL
jgi:preprotein translocase subunit SecA